MTATAGKTSRVGVREQQDTFEDEFQPRVADERATVGLVDSPFGFTTLAAPASSTGLATTNVNRTSSTTSGSSWTGNRAPAAAIGKGNEAQQVEEDARTGKSTANVVSGHQARFREDPFEFSKQLSLWANGTGWRAYDDYIGGRIFYEGYSNRCVKMIMESPQVNIKIRQLAEEHVQGLKLTPDAKRKRLERTERQMREVVYEMSQGLVAHMNSVSFLRFFGACVNNILVRMYDQGIHISIDEYAQFKQVALQAEKKKQSLLILPCHKSHIDYLTISWLFFRCGLSLPHIVAGSNLNMPVVGPMLQKCGAFFIRRTFGDDPLYPVVVKEYVEQLLENGMNIECFIEGGRSRTGKLLPPKLGILKYVVDAINNGRTEDVMICPISLQYDKVIETESYVNELLGNPKEKETLTGLLLNTRVVQLKLGRIDVRFQKPFSLKGWMQEQNVRRSETRPVDAPRDERKEQGILLRALGYQVLSDINKAAVIMPAGLVGACMLTIRGRGVGKSELIQRVNWLRSAIEKRGGRVADFAGMDVESVVDRALMVLKDLIGEHKNLIEPTYYPSNRFELSFYRNQVIHLFVSESMLCATLYTHVKAGGAAPSQRMKRDQIFWELRFISGLLQNEFVYGTEGLETNMKRTIDALASDDVILVEDDWVGLSPQERATGRNNFDFYNFLLWPFIETYWLAAVSLFALTPVDAPPNERDHVPWYAERTFHKSAQLLGKNAFYQGDISYLESINQATLANAFLRYVDMGIVQTRRSSASKSSPPLMTLHPAWIPQRLPNGDIAAQGKLWDFLSHLGTFRREGKNRRDNSTVSTRLFKNCSAISPAVVEWTDFAGGDEPASELWASKPNL
ncbi:hypothetical protein OIO90_003497 [Microbotryomycetes sp. JL221]|nr:hypothetical protein OIO90_003497 [Microbotryomycetes sp. JL221]